MKDEFVTLSHISLFAPNENSAIRPMLTKTTIRKETPEACRARLDALHQLTTATRNLIEDVEWTVEDPAIITTIAEKIEHLLDEVSQA